MQTLAGDIAAIACHNLLTVSLTNVTNQSMTAAKKLPDFAVGNTKKFSKIREICVLASEQLEKYSIILQFLKIRIMLT